MKLQADWVNFDTPSGVIPGYLAHGEDKGVPMPGMLVIHEIWGVNEHIQDVTERFARAGYVALAPDLYSLGGSRPAVLERERVQLAKNFFDSIPAEEWLNVLNHDDRRKEALAGLYQDESEQEQAGDTLLALFRGVRGDIEPFVQVLAAAAELLRSQSICNGQIGSVGWCLGGPLSALLACDDAHPQAAVIFYGAAPPDDRLAALRCPVRGFYGEDDPSIVADLPHFDSMLKAANADYELRIYPDTPHAFFNDTRPSYRRGPARDAWARTLAFFAQHLDPAEVMSIADAAGT